MPVFKSKDGTHGFTHRWKDHNGETKRIKRESKEWGAREAKRQLEAFILELSLNRSDGAKITYSQLYDFYITDKKNHLKISTLKSNEDRHKNHILPFWSNIKLPDINQTTIKKWQQTLIKKHKDGILTNRTVASIETNFKSVLQYAVETGNLPSNPFTVPKLRFKNVIKKEMSFYTLKEFELFYAAIDDDFWRLVFRVLFYTGLRKGELQALQVDDFKGSYIQIRKTWCRYGKKSTSPKTSNSYRDVFIDKKTASMIKDHIAAMEKCYGFNKQTYIFGFDKPVTEIGFQYMNEKYARNAKMKHIRIHDFRHSHVALLIDQGFSAFEISERMGHSVTMVNEVYGHLYPNSQVKMISKIEQLEVKNTESDTNLTRSEYAS